MTIAYRGHEPWQGHLDDDHDAKRMEECGRGVRQPHSERFT